jgi:hypothetical protein
MLAIMPILMPALSISVLIQFAEDGILFPKRCVRSLITGNAFDQNVFLREYLSGEPLSSSAKSSSSRR